MLVRGHLNSQELSFSANNMNANGYVYIYGYSQVNYQTGNNMNIYGAMDMINSQLNVVLISNINNIKQKNKDKDKGNKDTKMKNIAAVDAEISHN